MYYEYIYIFLYITMHIRTFVCTYVCVYICVYGWMYVYPASTSIFHMELTISDWRGEDLLWIYMFLYIAMYVHIYVRTHVWVYVCVCVCIPSVYEHLQLTISDKVGGACIMNIYVCLYITMYVRTYVCTYVCVCVCVCIPRVCKHLLDGAHDFWLGRGDMYYEYVCFCI